MPHGKGEIEEPIIDTPTSAPATTSARRLEAPSYYAATAQVLISGNDATLLFTRPHPAMLPDGTLASVPIREPVALVQMSIAGLKDLALTLNDIVNRVEQKTGEIHTELTQIKDLDRSVGKPRKSNGH